MSDHRDALLLNRCESVDLVSPCYFVCVLGNLYAMVLTREIQTKALTGLAQPYDNFKVHRSLPVRLENMLGQDASYGS